MAEDHVALVNVIGKSATGGLGSTLTPLDRAFEMLVFQTGNSASQAELNLVQQITMQRIAELTKLISQSGWTEHQDLLFGGGNNEFFLPAEWVHINGRLIYVGDPGGTNERVSIVLAAPPTVDPREDLAFLEFWFQEVAPTGSGESDDEDVRHYGGDNNPVLPNDILVASMPLIVGSKESTRRVQMRWRARAVSNIDFLTHPQGMSDPAVLARGGQAAPVGGYVFVQDTEDPNVWVAGNGSALAGSDLDTVNGYVFGMPIARVARAVDDLTIDSGEVTDLRAAAAFNNRVSLSGTLKSWGLGDF